MTPEGQDIPLPQDAVLAQLRTRGFEEGFQRTPLKEFQARLTSIGGHMVDRFNPPRLEVLYNFDLLEVIESTEPYLAPIAQITMLHSNREKSAMGYLGASIDRIINAGVPEDAPAGMVKGQDFLIGKMQKWKYTPGHPIYNRDIKADKPSDCWEVIWVEGFGAVSAQAAPAGVVPTPVVPPVAMTPVQQALVLLDGKTEIQFQQAVFNDPVVRTDTTLINQILQKQFIAGNILGGLVTVDAQGIHHVVKK